MAETGPHGPALTAEELKSQLYHKFQKKGILDDMRAQLRNRLVTELNTGTMLTSSNATGDRQAKIPLIVQVTNWLIAEHLRKHNYSYTLSVFVSESRTLTTTEDMFSLEDILQLLHVDSKSKLYQTLMERAEQETLGSILCHILRLLDVDLSLQDASVQWREDQCIQTENKFQMSVTYTFQEKMQQVEDLYYLKKGARRIESEGTVEGHLLKYQQHIEEKVRKEAKEELDTFKNRELLSMKHKEQEKFRREFDLQRREMEKEYRLKVESLAKREKKHVKDVEELREKLEHDTFNQRQEILSQLDSVRQKELEARRLAEMYRSESNVDKERLKAQKEKLKIREQALHERESALEKLISERAVKQRLDEQQQHVNKMAELQQQELKLTNLQKELGTQKAASDMKQLEASNAIEKTKDLESRVAQLQATETYLKQQNQRLNEEIRELDECRGAKSEAAVLKQEVANLQRSVQNVIADREHLSRLVQELKEQLVQPSPQVVALKRELEQEQDSRRLDKAIAQDQRSRLETELTTALDRNKAIGLRLEQQMMLAQQLQSTNRDLRDQLRSAYAFTGGPHRGEHHAAPSLVKQRSQPNLSVLNDENPSAFFDTSLNASQIPPELELQGRRRDFELPEDFGRTLDFELPQNFGRKTDFYLPVSQPMNFTFLQQSQNRLQSLEREAELLEQRYRDFHQRRLNKIPHMLDPQPPSFSTNSSTSTRLPLHHHRDASNAQHYKIPSNVDPNWGLVRKEQQVGSVISHDVFPSHVTMSNIKQNYRIVSDVDTFDWSYSHMPKPTTSAAAGSDAKQNEIRFSAKTEEDDSPLHSTVLDEHADGADNGSKLDTADEETFEFTTHFYVPPMAENAHQHRKTTLPKKLTFDDNPSYIHNYSSATDLPHGDKVLDVRAPQHRIPSFNQTAVPTSMSKSLPNLDLDTTWKRQASTRTIHSGEPERSSSDKSYLKGDVEESNTNKIKQVPDSAATLAEKRTGLMLTSDQRSSAVQDVKDAEKNSLVPKVDLESAWKAQTATSDKLPPDSRDKTSDVVAAADETLVGGGNKPLATINLDSQRGRSHNVPQETTDPQVQRDAITIKSHSSLVSDHQVSATVHSASPPLAPPTTKDQNGASFKDADYIDAEISRDDEKQISVASDNVADDFSW